jgi:hypothetical protein
MIQRAGQFEANGGIDGHNNKHVKQPPNGVYFTK